MPPLSRSSPPLSGFSSAMLPEQSRVLLPSLIISIPPAELQFLLLRRAYWGPIFVFGDPRFTRNRYLMIPAG
ncbi:hypothetical protein NDU88_007067 [Pleurodeles waltl]|uniref:Uncharacterized protein n=1 Tax=Pleurodeles waltl TaxID=8319 RepID=A0AAV7PMP9_PLEWA|nr:hypothetical protein NDU88_007067 [Pleurodeles waltl]